MSLDDTSPIATPFDNPISRNANGMTSGSTLLTGKTGEMAGEDVPAAEGLVSDARASAAADLPPGEAAQARGEDESEVVAAIALPDDDAGADTAAAPTDTPPAPEGAGDRAGNVAMPAEGAAPADSGGDGGDGGASGGFSSAAADVVSIADRGGDAPGTAGFDPASLVEGGEVVMVTGRAGSDTMGGEDPTTGQAAPGNTFVAGLAGTTKWAEVIGGVTQISYAYANDLPNDYTYALSNAGPTNAIIANNLGTYTPFGLIPGSSGNADIDQLQADIEEAFARISAVANINFVYAGPNFDDASVDFKIMGYTSIPNPTPVNGASTFPGADAAPGLPGEFEAFIHYAAATAEMGQTDELGGSTNRLKVAIHELLHGLGIAHPDDTGNGSTAFSIPGLSGPGDDEIDNDRYTVMSAERGGLDVNNQTQSFGYSATPMALDISALHWLYGAATNHDTNTRYTLSDNASASRDLDGNTGGALGTVNIGRSFYGIWDTGGTDEIRYTGAKNVMINLNQATLDETTNPLDVQRALDGLTTLSLFNTLLPVSTAGELRNEILDPDFSAGGFGSRIFNTDGTAELGGYYIANPIYAGGLTNDIENARGGNQNDILVGNALDNVLLGLGGTDAISGGDGNDSINTGTGDDQADGGTGNDTLEGRGGNDTLRGGAGDDLLDGGADNDRLEGGAGDDTLLAGTGDNSLNGGDGNDLFVYTTGSYLNDTISGGTGTDTILFSGAGDFFFDGEIDYQHTSIDALEFAEDGAVTKTVTYDFQEFDTTSEIPANLLINGSVGGTDILNFVPGGGNPTINWSGWVFQDWDDTIDQISITLGSPSNFTSTNVAETILGDGSSETINASGGNDTIDGGGGANTLIGGAGDDEITAGALTDSLDGGAGDDLFIHGDGHEVDNVAGGAGTDTFDASAETTNGITANLDAGTLDGLGGSRSFTDIENVIGTQGDDSITGNSDFNFLSGGGGNDTIVGDSNAGEDTLLGGDGDDEFRIAGSSFPANYDGGAGIDTFVGAGFNYEIDLVAETISEFDPGNAGFFISIERIFTQSGSDSITGSAGAEFISSGGDFDTISGGGGDDTIDAGGDDDSVDGGAGDDDILGGTGFDTIIGGGGDDTIDAGGDDDSVDGGDGRDEIAGGLGADTLIGGAGGDTLTGGGGIDSIDAGSGNDLILHGDGEDIDNVDGGAGNDTLDASAATQSITVDFLNGTWFGQGGLRDFLNIQTVIGTQANDVFAMSNGVQTVFGDAGNDRMDHNDGQEIDNFHGGAGIDTLDAFGEQSVGIDVNLNANIWTGLGGTRDITGVEIVWSTQADDTINGSAANENFFTYDGNDSVTAGLGDDFVDGLDGDDTLRGQGGNDTLFGGTGNDTVDGGNDNDFVIGSSGDDSILGGNGDDTLRGDDGVDTMRGGNGNDSLESSTFLTESDLFFGDAGDDTIVGAFGDETFFGASAADGSGFVDQDIISAFAGNDTLYGSDGDDVLNGGEGDDLLRGNGGDDLIDGSVGDDTVDYGAATGGVTVDLSVGGFPGAGLASGADGNDTVAGIESIFGSSFGDTLTGDDLDNRIEGRAGNDVLDGGDGVDTVDGGAGNDTIDGGLGNDLLDGGGGTGDIVSYQSAANAVFVDLTNNFAIGAAGFDTVTGFEGIDGSDASDTLIGAASDDRIVGFVGDDSLRGQDGNDELLGGGGFDTMLGGNGNDTLVGSGGNDTLFGQAGDDSLVGGNNNDQLDGGTGDDTLNGGNGDDDIARYTNSANAIFVDLDAGTVTGEGNDVLIGIEGVIGTNAGDDTILGSAGDDNLFGLSGQDTINGRAGDDILRGGNGNDSVIGGAGNDTVIGQGGDDTMIGGAGDDLLRGVRGNDIQTGGAGADQFDFRRNNGDDTVTDYVTGTDGLILDDALWIAGSGVLTEAQVVSTFASVVAGDVLFDFGAFGSLTLDGVNTTAGLAADITII